MRRVKENMLDTEIIPVITEGGITLVEMRQAKFFNATPLGCVIWLGLRDGLSFDQLIEKLIVERRVSEASARRGLYDFLDQLLQKSLSPTQAPWNLGRQGGISGRQERELSSWHLACGTDLDLAYRWLVDTDNAQWFDFGPEQLSLSPFQPMSANHNDLSTLRRLMEAYDRAHPRAGGPVHREGRH
jgi:hypothetical protein